MKHSDFRHHRHTRKRHTCCKANPSGFIKRTIRALAKKLNVSKRIVIFGFVVLFIFTKIFALLVFLMAYLWVKNPGKFEDLFDRTIEKLRRKFGNMGQNTIYHQAVAGRADPSYTATANEEDGLDFSDLKRKFDDLERRTENMEEHVASEEYKLRKEFEGI